ncbi:MAG TPA: poly-gamma-glutamate synthase PgsB [Acidobacteriota bacterium]|nr:poly-gamma-glutamate synthase PgsB [Acidobacteriota bacterium]
MVLAACFLALLVHLTLERVRLVRARARVPVRVAVAGTRGKSSVARLIAAGLRESGVRVLAKTTGSRPVLIFPDGKEREIARAGTPSVREQVRLVSLAARERAEALVVETMSIGEECLRAEAGAILKPRLLALTNARPDHLEAMGGDGETVARALTAAFVENAEILLPAEEGRSVFEDAAKSVGARFVPVARDSGDAVPPDFAERFPTEFEPNIRLSLAALRALGVARDMALRGMARSVPDFGSLRIWEIGLGTPRRRAFCVSAFAANEPESSVMAIAKARAMIGLIWAPSPEIPAEAKASLVGLLCLREDRGDRTVQWVRAAASGFFDDFERVILAGGPAQAAARSLRRRHARGQSKFMSIRSFDPAAVMDEAVRAASGGPVIIIGLGNIVGAGERFVRHWQETGRPHGH